jgi:hypothetical protein
MSYGPVSPRPYHRGLITVASSPRPHHRGVERSSNGSLSRFLVCPLSREARNARLAWCRTCSRVAARDLLRYCCLLTRSSHSLLSFHLFPCSGGVLFSRAIQDVLNFRRAHDAPPQRSVAFLSRLFAASDCSCRCRFLCRAFFAAPKFVAGAGAPSAGCRHASPTPPV